MCLIIFVQEMHSSSICSWYWRKGARYVSAYDIYSLRTVSLSFWNVWLPGKLIRLWFQHPQPLGRERKGTEQPPDPGTYLLEISIDHTSSGLWLLYLLPLYSLLLHIFTPRPLCSFASILILSFASVLISFSTSGNFSKSDVYGSISSWCFSDGFKICNFI